MAFIPKRRADPRVRHAREDDSQKRLTMAGRIEKSRKGTPSRWLGKRADRATDPRTSHATFRSSLARQRGVARAGTKRYAAWGISFAATPRGVAVAAEMASVRASGP